MDKETEEDQDEIIDATLDMLEEVANDIVIEQNVSWEEAHQTALREFLEKLKTAYGEAFGEGLVGEPPQESEEDEVGDGGRAGNA